LWSRVGDINVRLARPVNLPVRFVDDRWRRFAAILVREEEIDDFPGRYARDERRYFGRAEPPTPRNFVTRFGGRVLRKIDEKNEMSFAEATKLKQVRKLRTNERSLFFQLAPGGVKRRLGTLYGAAG
jgi:hypothetical protein